MAIRASKVWLYRGYCLNQSIELKNEFVFDLGELIRQMDSEHTENVNHLYSIQCYAGKRGIKIFQDGCATRNLTEQRCTCAVLVFILIDTWLNTRKGNRGKYTKVSR